MKSKNYVVFYEGGYHNLGNIFSDRDFRSLPLWSGRLSSGSFGLVSDNCSAGNRGPKNYQEILLASGNEGLRKLAELGFISCPVCKPEKSKDFFDQVREVVGEKYILNSITDFVDKSILGFDVRRLNFEELLPVIGAVPNRLYLPRGLSCLELKDFKNRFERIGFRLPDVGYYDKTAEGNFFRYSV